MDNQGRGKFCSQRIGHLKRDTAAMEFFHVIHCNATSKLTYQCRANWRIAGLLARKASYDCPSCDWWDGRDMLTGVFKN